MVVGGLGPRGDGVGQRTGIAGRAQDLRQPPGAAQRGDLLQHDPQLADQRLDPRAGPAVGQRLDLLPAARCAR